LHLAAVFGLDPKTAIRYAENARVLLLTTLATFASTISAVIGLYFYATTE
jgi:hypothetical protein